MIKESSGTTPAATYGLLAAVFDRAESITPARWATAVGIVGVVVPFSWWAWRKVRRAGLSQPVTPAQAVAGVALAGVVTQASHAGAAALDDVARQVRATSPRPGELKRAPLLVGAGGRGEELCERREA